MMERPFPEGFNLSFNQDLLGAIKSGNHLLSPSVIDGDGLGSDPLTVTTAVTIRVEAVKC
jgi:hypothetical protein